VEVFRVILPTNSMLLLATYLPENITLTRVKTASWGLLIPSKVVVKVAPLGLTVRRSIITSAVINWAKNLKLEKVEDKIVRKWDYGGEPKTFSDFLKAIKRYGLLDLPIEELEICFERTVHRDGLSFSVVEALSFKRFMISEKKIDELIVQDGYKPFVQLKSLIRQTKKLLIEKLKAEDLLSDKEVQRLAKLKSSLLYSVNQIPSYGEAKRLADFLKIGVVIKEDQFQRLIRDFRFNHG